MKKKLILNIILGTLLLFIWNAISWMGLPFHTNALNVLPADAIDLQALKDALPKDGIYHYPGPPESSEDMAAIQAKMDVGPRITFMMVKRGKTILFDPSSFGKNLLINLLTCIIFVYLLTRMGLSSLKQSLIGALALALLVIFTVEFPLMNWYMFPMSYTLVNVMDYVIGFLLLGWLTFAFRDKSAT